MDNIRYDEHCELFFKQDTLRKRGGKKNGSF